jgi:hypothetical protein
MVLLVGLEVDIALSFLFSYPLFRSPCFALLRFRRVRPLPGHVGGWLHLETVRSMSGSPRTL